MQKRARLRGAPGGRLGRSGPGPVRGSTTCAGGTGGVAADAALWHVVVGAGGDGDEEIDEVACLVGIEGGRATVEAVYD